APQGHSLRTQALLHLSGKGLPLHPEELCRLVKKIPNVGLLQGQGTRWVIQSANTLQVVGNVSTEVVHVFKHGALRQPTTVLLRESFNQFVEMLLFTDPGRPMEVSCLSEATNRFTNSEPRQQRAEFILERPIALQRQLPHDLVEPLNRLLG